MHDVTLCPGTGCPLRDGCLRYRARPVARFEAFTDPPYDQARQTCDALIALESLHPTDADVQRRAYDIWLAAGKPEGQADAHWEEARAALDAGFRESFE